MDTNNKGKNIVNGSVGEKVTDYVFDKFPAGMRVLIVDDDSTCLMVLEKMLKDCQYEVTTCQRARDALSMLREDKKRFDILLIDLHMPEMDGLRLLEIVGVEMDLPVVIMSSNDRKEVVMRGIVHGACDYLVKPVRMDAIKILWQHVIRKKKKDLKEVGQLVSVEDSMVQLKQPDDAEIGQLVSVEDSVVQLKQPDDADNMSARNKENTKSSKRRNDDEDEGEAFEEASSERKRRLVWTQELHQKFVMAVDQLGRNAVPRKILGLMQEMNVPGITREKIASHLQKYRLFLQRQSESPQEAKGPFVEYSKISVFEKASLLEGCNHRPLGESGKSIVEQFSSLDGCNPQACATSSQPPLHCVTIPPAGGLERQNANFHIGMPLVDQRNLSDNKIPESSSYPINRTKPSKLSFPFSRTSSGQSVFAKHICSGGLEMLNANSSLGLPVVDLTNHCDTKVTESSSNRVNELSRLASQLQRTNSGESVFAKIISSGGLERLDEDSNLGSPLIDQTNHLDPKMLGSSSYPVNELAMVALPLWRINSGDSIFGNVASGGLGRQNAESSLGSPLVDLTNLTKWPESSSYPVTELSTFPASLPLSRTSSGEIAANKSVPTLGNTSSGEEYIHRNLGNIAQQSRNLSIDDSYVLRDDNMSDLLLHFKSFYQGDILRGRFT